ncbi:MAG: hypothetical protein FJ288_16510 [Planctomycetes bacterium]|nr:hypothetical protein [Planctomycetota bacterium]
MNDYAKQISDECDALKAILIAKNAAYGASAFAPLRIFSRADPVEQLNVRIDDKLSRIARGSEYGSDDTELDLIGYLVLRRVARALAKPVDLPLVRIGQGDQARDIGPNDV